MLSALLLHAVGMVVALARWSRAPTRQRGCALAAHAAIATPVIIPAPPAEYSLRSSVLPQSLELVKRLHPDDVHLHGLVEEGSLVVVQRAADYSERRTDGYQEPELIYILGTSHLSLRSAEDVRLLLDAARPEAVVVELCRSRAAQAYTEGGSGEEGAECEPGGSSGAQSSGEGEGRVSEGEQSVSRGAALPGKAANPLGMSGPGLVRSFQRSLELGGTGALVVRLLLGSASQRLAAAAGGEGLVPGAEFRAARRGAQKLGAQLVLGDRPIEITLSRALSALPWRQRLALARDLLAGLSAAQRSVEAGSPGSLGQQAIEALKSDDAVSLLFDQLSERYPELVGPLISERDMYLAWSLQRSKAVDGCRAVVGVVGKGHLRGVAWALGTCKGGSLRFQDLVGQRGKGGRAERRARAAWRLALDTALFSALYVGWVAWTGQ